MRRRARRRPSSVAMSRVMSRLLVFGPWNCGVHSHHRSSDVVTTVCPRMPSGRFTDSTWMTSAPIMARKCPTMGPAQKAVKSATRDAFEREALRCDGCRPDRARACPGAPPRRGRAHPIPVTPWGTDARRCPRACRTRRVAAGHSVDAGGRSCAPRSGRSPVMRWPFPIGAAGTRRRSAISNTSAAVRFSTHSRIAASSSGRRSARPGVRVETSDRRSIRDARP